MIRQVPPLVLVPALVVVALVPWILYCARTYPEQALYFDHSMYQYTGWAIRQGDKLYQSVAVPDGPFITWLHALIQSIAGESDAAFRWADLVIQVVGASAIGAVLAPVRVRIVWAAAFVALWLAQYFTYDWGMTAQREAYYALVGYLGMAVLLLATRRTGWPRIALLIAGGFIVGVPMFGKHIGIIFVVLGLVPVALQRPRIRPLIYACAGGLLALVVGLLAVSATGNVWGFLFWYFEVPQSYRYVMASQDLWPLLLALDRHTVVLALLAAVGGGFAIWRGYLPRRYVGFVAAPVLFLLAVLVQRKGYVIHLHPVTAGSYIVFALAALHLLRARRLVAGCVVAAALVGDASYRLATSAWIAGNVITAETQLGEPHANHADLGAAARLIAKHTLANDRVFVFGPAARLLYEAKRKPAVPPFINFFFNVRRAITMKLTPDQHADVDALQSKIAKLSCPRLAKHPAAIAFCDWAAWSSGSAKNDVKEVCPNFDYLLYPEYTELGKFGCWTVWIRSDRIVPGDAP